MNARIFAVAGLALPLLVAAPRPSSSAEGTAWLHVRVEEPGKDSRVHVNLPLPVVEAALKMAPDTVASGGRIHLGAEAGNLKISDLRRLWQELKASGDTEIVSVEEKDERVNVSRKGELVMVRVQKAGRREAVHVDVPVAMVDALLSGEGDELDIRAGLAELRKRRGDVVRIDDEDSRVRIWIDENAGSPRDDR